MYVFGKKHRKSRIPEVGAVTNFWKPLLATLLHWLVETVTGTSATFFKITKTATRYSATVASSQY